jgi:hypothetical protein
MNTDIRSTTSEDSSPAVKPECVVVDTNIWRSTLLLKTALAHSLLYTIDRLRVKLGLPEVIERELKPQIVEHGLVAYRQAEKHGRILDALIALPFFERESVVTDLENSVDKRLQELAPVLQRVPFTFEHAQAALDLVINKLPPNEKNQQFKDSAIWQAVLELASNHRVHFVTKDSAFFANSTDSTRELAPILADECRTRGAEVFVYDELANCLLSLLGPEPEVDKERIVALIEPFIVEEVTTFAQKNRFELGEREKFHVSVFRTESAQRVAADFEIESRCSPIDAPGYPKEAIFRVWARGTCYYLIDTSQVTDVYLNAIDIKWRSPGGWGTSSRSLGGDPTITFYAPPTIR